MTKSEILDLIDSIYVQLLLVGNQIKENRLDYELKNDCSYDLTILERELLDLKNEAVE